MNRMKRFISAFVVLAITLSVLCNTPIFKASAVDQMVFSHEKMFDTTQGDKWFYYVREVTTNVYTKLNYDSKVKCFVDGKGAHIASNWMHTSSDATATSEKQTVLEFVCPYSGKINITDLNGGISANTDSYDGVKVWFWQNDKFLYEKILKAREKADYKTISATVTKGDKIRFILSFNGTNAGDSTKISPVITFANTWETSVTTTKGTGSNVVTEKTTPAPKGTEKDGVYSAAAAFDSIQGNSWFYFTREAVTNVYDKLKWEPKSKTWQDGKGATIAADWVHTSSNAGANFEIQTTLQFKAPSDGNITIYMANGLISVNEASGNGVRFGIFKNAVSQLYKYTDIGKGKNYVFKPCTYNVFKGETLSFVFTAINGDNSNDVTSFSPVIVYNSYKVVVEDVKIAVHEDKPEQKVYVSKNDYGPFVGPWYYRVWLDGSAVPTDMIWDKYNDYWHAEKETAAQISKDGAHPGAIGDSIRVFKAPKSGEVTVTTVGNSILMTAGGTGDNADGVYVRVFLYDGASVTSLMKKFMFLGDGAKLNFDPIKVHLYKGWELWFVVNRNVNINYDSVQYAPIVTYTKITNEKAPVYSNRNTVLKANTDYFSKLNERHFPWLNLLIAFGGFVGAMALGFVIIFVKRRQKKY